MDAAVGLEPPDEHHGGALVELALDDNGTRGTTDTVGVTVWDPAGGLWFSSRFDGVRTVAQRLTTGNLTVR